MRTRLVLLLAFSFTSLLGWTGCTSSRVVENTRVPEITIDERGLISFNNQRLELGEVAAAVKSAGFKRTQEVNILIPENADRTVMRAVSGEMVRHGYTRTVFVKTRKATAIVPKKP